MHPKDIRIERLTRNIRTLAETASTLSEVQVAETESAPAVVPEPAESKPASAPPRKKGRAAIVGWDLSHNPVGRAFVLYRLLEKEWDVDLIGPIWQRYGSDLWAPLKNAGLNVRAFYCKSIDEFVPKANLLAATTVYDVVYVCKPRLPSMYLGTLIKQSSACPMVLDVDDFELSFFKDESTLGYEAFLPESEQHLLEPYEEAATRYAQSLIPEFDAVTVSNVALRRKFGGHIVRHARDEEAFKPDPQTRLEARRQLGIQPGEFALVFIGTPRAHKGIFDVAQALHELDDESIVFHIVGDITDKGIINKLNSYSKARVVLHGNCEFDELPFLLSAADLVPLIQDEAHAISQFQIPAKISDATALGIPVLATATPPVEDLALMGGIDIVTRASLAERIRWYREKRPVQTREIRSFFENELGAEVNGVRLSRAIKDASDSVTPVGQELAAMVGLFDRVYQKRRAERLQQAEVLATPAAAQIAGDSPEQSSNVVNLPVVYTGTKAAGKTGRFKRATTLLFKGVTDSARRWMPPSWAGQKKPYDIVFFWKQNDSGIYGRRSDMVTRYLLRSDRVGKVLHLDAPIACNDIEQRFRFPLSPLNSQDDHVLYNLYDRVFETRDAPNASYRVCVTSQKSRTGMLAGRKIGRKQDYVDYVKREMKAAGMQPGNTIGWFCPIVWDAPKLIKEIGFGRVVSDLIDDQRGWNSNEEYLAKLEKSYSETLESSDLVFANCQPLADAFQHYAPPIKVVPNGAERLAMMPERDIPADIASLKGPVIGYVGNLRDRIDWMLLNDVVRAWPEASFVFIGPASDRPNALQLAEHPNVYMPGVVPYGQVLAYLRAFDVGIVPHLRNRLTERMNPLKLYNYFAAGLPVVSSDVSNIDEMRDSLVVAHTPEEFVQAIKQAAQTGVDTGSAEWKSTMDLIAWDTRIDELLDTMDSQFKFSATKRRYARSA